MEIRITTKQVLKILEIITWIIFIWLCVDAGSFIFNGIYSKYFNPNAADYFRLTELYHHDIGHFLVILLFMTIVGTLKAILFYLIVKLFWKKKFDPEHPFNKELNTFLYLVAWISLGIGLFSAWGVKYAAWISDKGLNMPDMAILRLDGAGVWLFMCVILFIIATIFKRGIEIQTENELTI